MDCPQCGAEVPSDDEFCGKCGYARRDHGPERLDQSRIRMHEEPDPGAQPEPTGPRRSNAFANTPCSGCPATGAPPAEDATPCRPRPCLPLHPRSSLRRGRGEPARRRRRCSAFRVPIFPIPQSPRRRPSDRQRAEQAFGSRERRPDPAATEPSDAGASSLRQRQRAAAGDPSKEKGASRACGARPSRGSLARLPLSDVEWLARRQTTRCSATSVGRATRPSPSSAGSAARALAAASPGRATSSRTATAWWHRSGGARWGRCIAPSTCRSAR